MGSASLIERGVRPAGSRVWVRLTEVPEQTPSRVYLTDEMRTQYTDGSVVAIGPGWDFGARRLAMWAEVGSRVVFNHWKSKVVDLREKISVVRDEDLLGTVDAAGEVHPLNGFVLLQFDERRTATESGIALPDIKQTRTDSGTILRYGPGRPIEKGHLAGLRMPVRAILGLPEVVPLEGLRVWFSRSADVWDVGHGVVEGWVIAAEDLVCYEAPR